MNYKVHYEDRAHTLEITFSDKEWEQIEKIAKISNPPTIDRALKKILDYYWVMAYKPTWGLNKDEVTNDHT